jgi:hypothetical protein
LNQYYPPLVDVTSPWQCRHVSILLSMVELNQVAFKVLHFILIYAIKI